MRGWKPRLPQETVENGALGTRPRLETAPTKGIAQVPTAKTSAENDAFASVLILFHVMALPIRDTSICIIIEFAAEFFGIRLQISFCLFLVNLKAEARFSGQLNMPICHLPFLLE